MDAKQFLVLSVFSIFLIFYTAHAGQQAISAAAVSLYVEDSQTGVTERLPACGNGVCEGNEAISCPPDCKTTQPLNYVFTIKLTYVLIILFIVIATILAGLLLQKPKQQQTWYNYGYQTPSWPQA